MVAGDALVSLSVRAVTRWLREHRHDQADDILDTFQKTMVDLALAALSIKILFLIHNQARVNHFQLWILTSIEWRLNEIAKKGIHQA